MSDDTLIYLKGIGEKAVQYDEVRSEVLSYILEKQIKDEFIATDLFVMGFLWLADRRGEMLNDYDIMMFLDTGTDTSEITAEGTNFYYLTDEFKGMSLDEVLDSYYNRIKNEK